MSTYLKKIERPSVVQYVIDAITQGLLSGELKPGDRIPTEMELSRELNVARNSVREAVKVLVNTGVLEIRRAEGTFVCSGFTKSMMDPVLYGIILNQQNRRDIGELRIIMESGVLRLAAQKHSDDETEPLRRRLEELKTAILEDEPDAEDVFDKARAFHDVIIIMCHNEILSSISDTIAGMMRSMQYEKVRDLIASDRKQDLLQSHESIYAMVTERRAPEYYDTVNEIFFAGEDLP